MTGEEMERARVSDDQDDDLDIIDHLSAGNGLRVVPQTDQGHQPTLDPELKATLDEMNRRYRVQRERNEAEDDTPDAA
jgi:hypothetical protein